GRREARRGAGHSPLSAAGLSAHQPRPPDAAPRAPQEIMPYRSRHPVRFGDVDHAGIVYYPQFFIYFHEAFEDFFNSNGLPYDQLLNQRRPPILPGLTASHHPLPLPYREAPAPAPRGPDAGARSPAGHDVV